MLTNPEYRNTVDKLWDNFWSSGITNPIVVIEQMVYLIFLKLLDEKDANNQRIALIRNTSKKSIFEGKEDYRWSKFKQLSPNEMLEHVRDKVFVHLKDISPYFASANWHINKASLLDEAVQTLDRLINKINDEKGHKHDTKGDLYEYMLSKLGTAKQAGQFRTPRHIIDMMVELINPQPGEKICDPACGSAGFLVSALLHVLKSNTSDIVKDDDPFAGDNIPDTQKEEFKSGLYGYDFDSTMLRIAAMNLILHDVDSPNILYTDTLSKDFTDESRFDIVLANPPFKGSIDKSEINPKLKASYDTYKTELLFIGLFLRLLNTGGRGAVIIPSGVLSTESNAHKTVRRKLIENNQLEAVITMPSGVFKPYAGVATAVLVFTKGGQTEKVWFYEMANDGYSLDDKRNPIDENDIPDIAAKYKNREESDKSFNISFDELKENEWNLLPSRYKKVEHKAVEFECTPLEYIEKLIKLEESMTSKLYKLKEKVGG